MKKVSFTESGYSLLINSFSIQQKKEESDKNSEATSDASNNSVSNKIDELGNSLLLNSPVQNAEFAPIKVGKIEFNRNKISHFEVQKKESSKTNKSSEDLVEKEKATFNVNSKWTYFDPQKQKPSRKKNKEFEEIGELSDDSHLSVSPSRSKKRIKVEKPRFDMNKLNPYSRWEESNTKDFEGNLYRSYRYMDPNSKPQLKNLDKMEFSLSSFVLENKKEWDLNSLELNFPLAQNLFNFVPYQEFSRFFGYSLQNASLILNVSVSDLIQSCLVFGYEGWPNMETGEVDSFILNNEIHDLLDES